MSKVIAIFLGLIFLINANFIAAKQVSNSAVKVGILVPMQHRAMNEIVSGFKTELKKKYPGRITFLVKNAQGDANLQRAILQGFKQMKIDLFVPISTTTTQMTLAMVRSKPVVGVAALYTEKEREKRAVCNVTAVNDEIPVADQIKFMRKVIPDLKQITLVHSLSAKIMPEVKDCIKYAKTQGIKVQDLMVQQLFDLYTISGRISLKSQAVFVLKDSLIASGIRTVINQADIRRIPVISADDGTVQQGTAFAVGVKEHQVGVEGAGLAAKVLQGTDVCKVPIKVMDKLCVFINKEAVKKQSFTVAEIEKKARESGYQVFQLKTLKR